MSKEQKNKMKNPDNIDFDNLSDISSRVDEMMDKVKEEEMKVDLQSLDDKFLKKLGGSEFIYMTEKLNKKLDKSYYSTKLKDTQPTQQMKPSSFSWFNFALAGFLLMVIVSSGLVLFMWPEDTSRDDADTEIVGQLAQEVAQPKVQMRPSSVTTTGFVKEDSEFVFEVEGEFEGDPEEVISVTPAIPLEVEAVKEGNVTILTAVPEEPLEREENYTFAVEAGTLFADGSEIEENIEWLIPVEPYFKVVSTSPFDNEQNVATDSSVSLSMSHEDFTFDDFVANFSIVPFVKGAFEKIQENVLFKPDDGFAPGIEYTITLANLLETTDGESLEEEYAFAFNTSVSQESDALGFSEGLSWYGPSEKEITRVINVIFTEANAPEDTDVIDYTIYKVLNNKHLDVMKTSDVLGSEDSAVIPPEDGVLEEPVEVESTIESEEEVIEEGEEYKNPVDDIIDNSMLMAKESLPVGQPLEYTPRDKGLYLVSATVGEESIYQYYLVTDLSVVVTQFENEMQGWIYDTQQIHDSMDGLYEVYDENGELIDYGSTDDSGYFRSEIGKYLVIRYREDMDIWVNNDYGDTLDEFPVEGEDSQLEESSIHDREDEWGIASSNVVFVDDWVR